MALLDGYATDTDFRSRVNDKSTNTDSTLNAQLVGGSRLMERSMGLAPGYFNAATGARTFDAYGGTVLELRDRRHRGHALRTVPADGIELLDSAGAVEYSLDFDDAWVRGLPDGNDAFSEPFTDIEILSHLSTASPSRFPNRPASVRFAADTAWGWEAVPNEIVEFLVHMVQELREGHLGGATMEIPSLDGALPMQSQLWRRWADIKRLYGRKTLVVA